MKLHHKFKRTGDYEYESEPATEREIAEARRDFQENDYSLMAIGRSCWLCNKAHVRLIDRPAMNCFWCGRVFHRGVDITIYTGTEWEGESHIDEDKVQEMIS